jgi:hypothetical protein
MIEARAGDYARPVDGGEHMNVMENFARQFVWEIVRIIDLAVQNWAITMLILIVFILGAGRQRKRKQRHLETVGSN